MMMAEDGSDGEEQRERKDNENGKETERKNIIKKGEDDVRGRHKAKVWMNDYSHLDQDIVIVTLCRQIQQYLRER